MGDEDPGFGGGDGLLPVFGQAPAPSELGESALNNPSLGQNLETVRGVGPLDDLEGPVTGAAQSRFQFRPGIASVGEDVTQPRPARADRSQYRWRTVAVLEAKQNGRQGRPSARACR